jgi:DNA polymerase I
MRRILTHELPPLEDLDDWTASQVYNGLDCVVTREVLDAIEPQLDQHTRATYDFERELQGPILEMRLRGVAIDLERRDQVIEEYADTVDRLEQQLERIVGEGLDVWGWNWRSPKDLRHIFFDTLNIPRGAKGSVDRHALERINSYFVAKPIVSHILAMREIQKKIDVLKTEIDTDGRIRTSYNIAGTNTGRLSSSFSEFGTGTNLQNIEESLRSIFIADPGYKLGYFDAEQGESREVGAIEWNLFNDGRYLDACETGDLHTSVAKLVWPNLPWTGDLGADRKLAERRYFRHYDRRFMCKKIGHGTNYGGKPATLAQEAEVEIGLVREFQPIYMSRFPSHERWHEWTDNELRSKGHLITIRGRKRWFFGRRDDNATLREGLAYQAQSSLADYLDRGMLNVWRERKVQLLMQIHDAILVQFDERLEDGLVELVRKRLEFPLVLKGGRVFTIPYGMKTGWNWGTYSESNPDGLKTYHPGDKRKRTPPTPLMDRRFYGTYRKVSTNA